MTSVKTQGSALDRLRAKLAAAGRPASLSHQRFDETHELFERSSNQQQLILQYLKDFVGAHDTSLEPIKILSVGCGSGILDNPLIESIAKTYKSVEYTGVDPNGIACQRFQENFDNLNLPNVRLNLSTQDIESLETNDRFHVIHIVHTLYYFDDPANTLETLLGLLAPGGKLVVVQAPNAAMNQLATCFWSHHEENGIWFSDCLSDHLSSRSLAFTKQPIDGEVDVTRCFEKDCPRGEMILDFITQSDCRQLDDDIVELSLSYLRSVSRKENDRFFVGHPADAFVIEGTPAKPRPS